MAEPFDWKIALRDIGDRGLSGTREADAAERLELAEALDIVSCSHLRVIWEVHPLRSGMYRLTGTIDAGVVQSCVVTLEPLPSRVEVPLNVELRPGDMMPEPGEGEQPILDTPDIEPIEADGIDLGLIVLEHIATSLDPYPRKEDAVFEFEDPAAAVSPINPFAKLAKLKPPP